VPLGGSTDDEQALGVPALTQPSPRGRGLIADRDFDERERWPEERWRRYQWRRLRAVLRTAYDSLPFYRKRLDAVGLAPESIRSIEDYSQVPLLRKGEVLAAMRERGTYAVGMETIERAGPWALGMTSGTLGTAFLSFPQGWRRETGDALRRAYWWAGLRPGMRMMMAAPAWHSLALQESWVAQRLGAECVIPWGTFLPRFAESFLDTLLDLRPAFVSLFLPMLYGLLAECRRRGQSPDRAFAGVQSVLVVGAPLTPGARQNLKDELGVGDLFEGAGNPEGLIAMECEQHAGHHCFVDTCYVEIIDAETGRPLPPGRRGSVVVSTLARHGSVHLRYEAEDVGEIFAEPCPCGRTWPRLEIYDRRANRFRAGGRELLWYDVRECLDEVPELIGTPFAVIRRPGGSPALRIAMEQLGRWETGSLGPRIEALAGQRLGVPLQLEWVEGLPERWKGVTVIDEKEWEAAHV